MSDTPNLNPTARGFLERVSAASRAVADFSGISRWLVDNTRDPRDSTKPWSFQDHEYQIDIANDARPQVVARKCAQVGLSELQVRLMLAMLAIYNNVTAIYTLPTTSFARQFTRSRVDPVVASSPALRSLVTASNDSSELKQIGSAFLYIRGSFGQGAAISIPADILITDEVDFSNQKALTTFASRLGHAKMGGGHGIRRGFSTPTVEGFGVSKTFDLSTQAYYLAKCDHCHQWVCPSFMDDVIIPGFDRPIIELEPPDVNDTRYRIADAHLHCPECRGVLTVANLADPTKRQWVEKHPGRAIGGYQVSPFDVPTINPIPKTLGTLADFEKADWVNFKLGLPFEDAENAFLRERIDRFTTLRMVQPAPMAARGCVMGVDVGKTSWVVIGLPHGARIKILWMERVVQDGNDRLHNRLVELMDWFGVVKCVIDAAPDFSIALKLVEHSYVGQAYANYYVRTAGKKLTERDVQEDDRVLKTDRTRSLDILVKEVNGGVFEFPHGGEIELFRDHLMAIKRVKEINNQGELVARWINTGPDHYGHALNYLRLASGLLGYRGAKTSSPALPLASLSRLQSGDEGHTPHPLTQRAGDIHGRH